MVCGHSRNFKVADFLVGEVWFFVPPSGLQRMVATSAASRLAGTRRNANFPREIRQLEVARVAAETLRTDLLDKGVKDAFKNEQLEWTVCSPDTVSKFTAVGYYFARKLHQDLNVPIGLVNSSWGGTICEAWTSRPGLQAGSRLETNFGA